MTQTSNALQMEQNSLHSETEVRELFESWCKEYDKTYSSEEEKHFRFNIFKEKLAYITRENQKVVGFRLGLNAFSDETADERSLRFMRIPVLEKGFVNHVLECVNSNCSKCSKMEEAGIEDKELERYVMLEFESWLKKYPKTYHSEEEKIYRFGIFRKNLTLRRNTAFMYQMAFEHQFAQFSYKSYADRTFPEMKRLAEQNIW